MRFTAPAPPPPPPGAMVGTPVPMVPAVVGAGAVVDGAAPAESDGTPAVISQRGAFKATDQGIFWTCPSCDSENHIEEIVCPVCGTKLAESVKPEVERPERDANAMALMSLFFPGAGHAMMGLWGEAISRGVISIFAVGATLVFGIQGAPVWITVAYGLVATALWAAAAHDAWQEANGRHNSAFLVGRRFTFVVLGMIMLLMLGFVMSALTGGISVDPEDITEVPVETPGI
ncbi:MAG TPA: zinc ribbon domain-containing protein [Actinomycetota bacterium]|nr:zinc ribbon domain-containing protein [Actinomycetota bacterium]